MAETTLIKNGIIVDGLTSRPVRKDIKLVGDKIAEVGVIEHRGDFDHLIDAAGCYVTPGFIDMHSHTDLMNFINSGLKPKLMQGITTEVIGQCGLGVAPISPEKKTLFRKNLIIGDQPIDWSWETTKEYLSALESHGLESNLVPFTGHGVLRFAAKGNLTGDLTTSELRKLTDDLEQAFAAGSFGVSFGFVYLPAIFSNKAEIEQIVEVADKYGAIITVHLRSEGSELLDAISEMISLTRDKRCKLHISHLKAIGWENEGAVKKALDLVDNNNLTFDHYPYFAGSTTLLAVFPPFVFAGESENILNNLLKPEIRERIKRVFSGKEMLPKGLPWDNLPQLIGWENIKVIGLQSKINRKYLGMTIQQIADLTGKDPVDAAINLVIEEQGNVKMIDFYMSEESLIKILKHPSGMFGTDSLFGGGLPHPRGYGSYPRIINRYVFAKKILSLEQAVAKMTSLPAKVLGLTDRGLLQPGYAADINIFDKGFKDRATYDNPCQFSEGLKYVLINGKIKVKDGTYLAGHPGRVIRRER